MPPFVVRAGGKKLDGSLINLPLMNLRSDPALRFWKHWLSDKRGLIATRIWAPSNCEMLLQIILILKVIVSSAAMAGIH